jgi:hypothetical protein
MLLVTDQVRRHTSIPIDGVHFVRCKFDDCELIYRASDEVDFDDCTFVQCERTFDDAAVRTLGFLSTLFKKTGPDGQRLVESIFKGIRSEKIAQLRAEAQSELTADAITVPKSA